MADVTLTDDNPTRRSSRGLRAFDTLLSLLTIALTAGTAILVPVLGLQTVGRGTVSVDGEIAVPYSFAIDGGPRIHVDADGSTTTEWDGPADGNPYEGVRPAPRLPTTIDLDNEDVDARIAATVALVLFVGAAWVGLVSLRRVVRSAVNGNPFDIRNVARLRWCALAVLSTPTVGWTMARLLDVMVDADAAGAQFSVTRPDWGVYVLAGLGLLALAEVFRAGAVLQELEQSTV